MLEETAARERASPPKMLVLPTEPTTDPASIASLFDTVEGDLWPDRSSVQQRRHQYPQNRVRGSDNRAMVERRRVNLTGSFLCAQHAADSQDEEPGTARRAHYQ
jgi:hypothetical protein